MRIATYRTLQRIEIGVLSQDGSAITPFDLPPARAEKGLLAVLEADQALLPLRSVDHPHRIGSVELLAPIPRPRRNILCIGKNYYEHVKEIAARGFDTTGGGAAPPEAPIVFSKTKRVMFQSLLAKCLCARILSSDIFESAPGAVPTISDIRTASMPYFAPISSGSMLFPSDFESLRPSLSRTRPWR